MNYIMVIITNVTTNGTFEWGNESIQGSGNFTKNDNGDVIQLYFSGSYKSNPQSQCQLNANKTGENYNYNINSDNLSLIIAFATYIPTIIQDLTLLGNEEESENV